MLYEVITINAKAAAAGDLEPAKSPTVPSDGGKNGNGFTYFFDFTCAFKLWCCAFKFSPAAIFVITSYSIHYTKLYDSSTILIPDSIQPLERK